MITRTQLRSLIESVINENSKDSIQLSLSGKLEANGVNFDSKVYGDMHIVSGEYLGSINSNDAKKIGNLGLKAIIQQVNKKYGTDIKTVTHEGGFDSQGSFVPNLDLYFGIGDFKIEFSGH